ncbi:MAG: Unknown protein [uncultured Sulfurovum sp.]|uniref:GTPase domain-containing protein n=1 Tax=uncultured Sulfurovum sp. TaxID=269237 RepID=A0A6S6S870_9BACT|nr:MAG: Unknown protein [uncultured Sulfurovum sp.]
MKKKAEDTVEVNNEETPVIETEEVTETKINNNKSLEASVIIKNHMMASMGFGVIPIPLIDLVGLTGTQLNMLRKLSDLYGHEFSEEFAKKAIASLLGGGLALPVAMGLSSLVKIIPVVGQAAGTVSLVTTGAASTYAIGHVFVKHFESGGDFLSFSSKKAKEDFNEELNKGKKEAVDLETTKATA